MFAEMKRVWLYVVLSTVLILSAADVAAQRIAYDERVPKINLKKCNWLDDIVPEESDFVYIGFVYSRSETCLDFCYAMRQQIERMEHPMTLILVTREPSEMIESHIREFLGAHVGMIIDDSGRIFREFGVRYVPFGVLVDYKWRALWFGNPLTADRNLFKNMSRKDIKERKKSKKR